MTNLSKQNEVILGKYIRCVVCLEILNSPLQCKICDTLICEECLPVLIISEKKCFGKCSGNYKKASKYIRSAVSSVEIHCKQCNSTFSNQIYFSNTHLLKCLISYAKITNLRRDLKIKEEKNSQIQNSIDNFIKNQKKIQMGNLQKLLKSSVEQIRNVLMSFGLSVDKKMELYYAVTQGNLPQFRDLIENKKYPLLEEISYQNYFWTSFHYAMHFGQIEIIYYIINTLKEENILEAALKLHSNDGRCPLLCLLKSNHISTNLKEEIFVKILDKYYAVINLSKEVKKEALARGYEKILKRFGKF